MNDGRQLLRAGGSDSSIAGDLVRVPTTSVAPGCPVFTELLSKVEDLVSHETTTKYVGLWAQDEGEACYGGGEGGATSHAYHTGGLKRCLAPNTDLLLAYKTGAPSSMAGLLELHPEAFSSTWARHVCPEVCPKHCNTNLKITTSLGIRSMRPTLVAWPRLNSIPPLGTSGGRALRATDPHRPV